MVYFVYFSQGFAKGKLTCFKQFWQITHFLCFLTFPRWLTLLWKKKGKYHKTDLESIILCCLPITAHAGWLVLNSGAILLKSVTMMHCFPTNENFSASMRLTLVCVLCSTDQGMLEPLCKWVIINYSSGGDSGDTLLLSTTSHKEVEGRWGPASSPRL